MSARPRPVEPGAYEVDGMPASAADFIAVACDPGMSVVVDACAGSGKTWLLVARMLRLLLAGCEPSALLAITFTRKAAQEMQERLMLLLQELALQPDAAVAMLLAERGVAAHDIARLLPVARGLYQRILSSAQALSIDTFHSWFARLLQIAPLASGVPHGYALSESSAEMLAETDHRFMQAINATEQAPVREALRQLYALVGDHQAKKLLDAFIAMRAEWWAARLHGSPLEALQVLCGPDGEVDARLSLWSDGALCARILRIARLLGQGTAVNQKRAVLIETALGSDVSVAAFDALCNEFFDAGGTLRRNTATKALLAALQREAGAPAETSGIAPLAQDGFDEECAAVAAELRHLQARSYEPRVLALNAALMTVGDAYLDLYQALKAERRVFDFADLEWHVYRLLANPQHAAYLQSRLDARYRHVLLDEFQDTNPLQWSVVRSWLEAYGEDGARPSVFIVGDPKQSIYRFRRAEPRVFVAARELLQSQGARVLRTRQTRRNAGAITAALNHAFVDNPLYFAQTTLAGDEGAIWRLPLAQASASGIGDVAVPVQVGAEAAAVADVPRQTDALQHTDAPVQTDAERAATSSASAGTRDPDALRDLLTTAREEEDDARRLQEGIAVARAITDARAVHEARTGASMPWSDVMLLVKKRAHLPSYERALREAGIPFVSDKRGGLLESLEVSDMIALLTFLITPGDDRSLAHVLKSPLFGADDTELMQLAVRREATWWLRLQALADCTSLAAHARAPLPRAARLLASWRMAAPRLPVHDLLDIMLDQGEIVARYAQSVQPLQRQQVIGNLHAFTELALKLDAGRYPSLPKFIDALRTLQKNAVRDAPDEAAIDASLDAVRILTIHSAKGLEAPIVVLLDANHSEPAREDAGVLCVWPQQADGPTHFSAFGRLAERGLAREAFFADEQRLKEQEDWNLLYVASTRAKQLLIISGVAGGRNAGADGVVTNSWYARLRTLVEYDPAQRQGDLDLDACAGADFDPQPDPDQAAASGLTQAPAFEDGGVAPRGTGSAAPMAAEFSLTLFKPQQLPALAGMPDAAAATAREAEVIAEGLLLHALMERITDVAAWPIVPPGADVAARWLGCSVAQATLACAQARRILSQPSLRRFFDATAFRSAHNELDLIADGEVMRLDRVVHFAQESWILDYKRSVDEARLPAYIAQLGRYRRVLLATGAGASVHTALIDSEGRFLQID